MDNFEKSSKKVVHVVAIKKTHSQRNPIPLTQKLQNYFQVDDKNVQVSLLSKREIKCTNLLLLPDKINKPTMPMHVRYCSIGLIQISFNSKKSEKKPLTVIIQGVKLILKFNDKKKQAQEDLQQKKKQRPMLQQFYKAVGSEQQYKQRTFFQEQLHQLTQLIAEYALGELYLQIADIDFAVEYSDKKPKYFGIEIGEIVAKQELGQLESSVQSIKSTTSQIQSSMSQFSCQIRNMGAYLGSKFQYTLMNLSSMRQLDKIQKKPLLMKSSLKIKFNMAAFTLEIDSHEIEFNFEDILIYELLNFSKDCSTYLGSKPMIRPGDGKVRVIQPLNRKIKGMKPNQHTFKVSQGTLVWWQLLGDKILEKIRKKRTDNNIISNTTFRKYMFCLLYRYTHGAHPQLQKFVDDYEFFKTDMQVLIHNKNIINTIEAVKQSPSQSALPPQVQNFISFLASAKSNDQQLTKMWLKKLDYKQIKNSDVIVNFQNCHKFLQTKQAEAAKQLIININIHQLSLKMKRSKLFYLIRNELRNETPENYMLKKKQTMEYYCNQTIINSETNAYEIAVNLFKMATEKGIKQDKQVANKCYFGLTLKGMAIDATSNGNVALKLPEITLEDLQSEVQIVNINGVKVKQQNMHPEAYRWKIGTERVLGLQIDQVYIALESKFVEKVLTVMSYISEPGVETKKSQKNFISQFISKKVPNHPLLNTYKNTTVQFLIKSIVVSTPVFDRDRNFEINLKMLKFSDPVDGKSTFELAQAFILRSNAKNTLRKTNLGYRSSKKPTDETVLMTTTRALEGSIQKQTNNNITQLVIPFILLQLACQDVYYVYNIMKVWSKIISNPYYFPPKIKAKQEKVTDINPNAVKFAKSMKKYSQYVNTIKCQLEGIQIYLLSDHLNQENNRIMDLLIDNLNLKMTSTYSQDRSELTFRDLYLRNCLSFKAINKEALISSIKDQMKFGDEPVLYAREKKDLSSQQRNAKMDKDKELMLFFDPESDQKNVVEPIIGFYVSADVNLQSCKSITRSNMKVVPLFIFYSIEFTDMINTIFATINGLSSENIQNYETKTRKEVAVLPFSMFRTEATTGGLSTDYNIDIKDTNEQNQIMFASQFEQINRITGEIKRLNLLAVKNSSVVYTISLAEIAFRHRTQLYVKRFFFDASRLIIVDTSEEAGPQPIIIDLNNSKKSNTYPLKGSFTSYNSQIMKYKEKKSAYFHLAIQGPEINFLKKKVLQLVNFLMILLRQVGVMPQPDQQQASKPKQPPSEYPLRYKIEILEPKVRLFRSSLSKEGFKAIGTSINVLNFIEEQRIQGTENTQNQESILDDLEQQRDFDEKEEFYPIIKSKRDEVQYMSFQKEKNTKVGNVVEKIFIKINNFEIFGVQHWQRQFSQLFGSIYHETNQISPMLYIQVINIEFFSPEMILIIPRIEGNLFDEDYRVLIRMTEQNLSETPLLFVDNPRVQTQIKMSFRTTFTIQQFVLDINILEDNVTRLTEKLKKRIQLQLQHLTGKNELYTNSQILTQLSIKDLALVTQNEVTIISRLSEEHLGQLPQIPKSNAYTDMETYAEFKQMEKYAKKVLKKLLQNETESPQTFDDDHNKDKQQANESHAGPQDKTNTEKICQWIKGMIKKCGKCCRCRCCKKRGEQDSGANILENMIQLGNKNNESQFVHSEILLDSNRFKNRTAPMIYHFKDMLDFQHSINWDVVERKKKEPNMVYLNFIIRPNGQKQMYLQAKKLQVLVQNSKGLIGLSMFFGRPYSISDVPEHVRKYKFNNNKPFKMLIEVDDALAEIRALNEQGKMEKISVICDLIYDNENRGDTMIGPGVSKMRVESMAKIMFMSENFKNPIDLSDSFKAIFISQNKIPYGQNKRNQSKQQILLKPHEKQDWNISFFIPAFALKSINRIIVSNFYKIHSEDQQQAEMEKRKDYEKGITSRQQKKQEPSNLKKPKSFNHNFDKKGLGQTMNLSKKASQGHKNGTNNVSILAEYKKEQMSKSPVPAVIKQSHVIRSLYISQITFEIESKLESSFIKSKISDIKYTELNINNKTYKRNTRQALATLNVNYWNLKLGVYEPCIEPWRFRMDQDVYQRDNLSSSNLKIASELDPWKFDDNYVNDLNVNVSLALYQTYKELMIVYEQENYDQNQDCIDLTKIDKTCYDVLFDRDKTKRLKEEQLKRGKKNDKILARIRKYFTRVFVPQGQNLKRYIKEGNKSFFNPPSLKLFVFHSYFDHFRRKKCLTYRTPYRIFNSTNVNLILWFLDPKQNFKWKITINKFEHYAIPARIYQSDFLVHISDQFLEKPQQGCPYVSVKYLIQMRAKMKSFKKITPNSVIWKNIFKYSSAQTQKLVDYRDMIITVGKHRFTAVNVYSKHQPKQQQTDQKYDDQLKYYDAYCILQSPIIIDNYTYLDLKITLDHNTTIEIPQNQRIEINQNIGEGVSDTVLEFENDSLHEERRVMWENYGETERTMEIQKLQSIKLVISRETTSSCLIKIFSQWNISNYTNEAFSFKCSQKLLLIDSLSFNCLSNISNKGIDICIVNQQSHTKTIKPNNIADVITLAKKCRIQKQLEEEGGPVPDAGLRRREEELLEGKRRYERERGCGCFPGSDRIYEYIDFVINSKEDPIEPLRTQKIEFRYRYLIRNLTGSLIRLCQHDTSFLIAELPPYLSVAEATQDPTYIFYYNFIPQQYFIEIEHQDISISISRDSASKGVKKLRSCNFKLDQFPGSTFIIKIKKDGAAGEVEKYEDRFYYLRFEVKKIEEETLIQIMNADEEDFPIYLNNVTDHHIKIIEGDDQFILKPQYRMPFAWADLGSKDYKMDVSIEGTDSRQTYLFNNKSAFEPLKIIDKNSTKKRKGNKELYLRDSCFVVYSYMGINAQCLVILNLFNNKLFVHNKDQNINHEVDMNQVQRVVPLASKIELYLEGNDVLELVPPPRNINKWIQNLQACINSNVTDKIFFTIESYNNSRIFFFRTMGQQQFESSKQQYSISHLNISLISSQPEEIILLYLGNITYVQHDKQNKLNYKNLQLSESDKLITIKKFKVSNQTKDAVNPVVISQIKKSNYPFLQLRLIQQKLHFSAEKKNKMTPQEQLYLKQQQEKITHYKEVTFFVDEAEVMVEAALFLKMFGLKKNFDHITNQYAVGAKMSERDQELIHNNNGYEMPVHLVNIENAQPSEKSNPQVYINYLEIKPIKMTVSVYLEHNSQQNVRMDIISIVRYIPFGIENAIIQMQSFQFFHVFYNMNQLKKQFIKYYTKQAWNQIYKNAGSYDMFVPIQLVGGVGNGVKQIFYDPIYELVKKKEIKAVGKTFCEGLLSFIVFLVGFLFKIVNLAFKILAVFTFDREYKTKRQAFRKQIFKSPVEGAVLGAKNFWNVFKSVFTNFQNIPKDFAGYYFFGYIFGFFISILKIIPWAVKLVVSLYDWIYVIGLGFLNWGYYQQSAMKARSRPRRTFFHKQIINYNYLHALGNEIILKNQLQKVQNQQIYFVKSIQGKDDSNYLILSNYRIIHNYFRFAGMQQIKLYQLLSVACRAVEKKSSKYEVVLDLSIPNMHKVLFLFSYSVNRYQLEFRAFTDAIAFVRRLKFLCMHQRLEVRFEEGERFANQINTLEGVGGAQFIFAELLENNVHKHGAHEDEDDGVAKQRNRWRKPPSLMVEQKKTPTPRSRTPRSNNNASANRSVAASKKTIK